MKVHKLQKGGYIAVKNNFDALSTDTELIIFNEGEEVYRCDYKGDKFKYVNTEYNIERWIDYSELYTKGFIYGIFKEKENYKMLGKKFTYSTVQWALHEKMSLYAKDFYDNGEAYHTLFNDKLSNISLPHHLLGNDVFDVVEDNDEYKSKLANILAYLEYVGFKTISDIFPEEFGHISKGKKRQTLNDAVEMIKSYLQEKLYLKKKSK